MTTGKSAVKINPPRTGSLYSRAALVGQLQAARQQPLVWISAPAGAGKTTLVVDYLASQTIPALWYQLDAGDTDPATFFHYLAQASYHLCKPDLPLPSLTPEYHGNLAIFTRSFAERLCADLIPPVVFVFDNFQELPHDSPLQPLFREFTAALPAGFQAFFLSRDKPPAWVAGFAARHAACLLDRDDLRLTEVEAIGIVRLLGNGLATRRSEADIRRIHQAVDGWAAGLILMYRAWQKDPDLPPPEDGDNPELVFDYFASELLERLPATTQTFLLQSALLPTMPVAQVSQLTAHPQAERILQNLYDRNFFLTRSNGAEPVYSYHPLFRAFLLKQGQERWERSQLDALRQQAAHILRDAGQPEVAIELALAGGDWLTAASMIATQAPHLLAQGRHQTLLGWLQRLPETLLAPQPWLLYWQGAAFDGHDPLAAGRCFSTAYPLFEQAGDASGMYQTLASALLVSWMTQQNHQGIDQWLQRFDHVYAQHPAMGEPASEARVVSAVLMGMSYRRPDHPQAETLLARARQLWALPLEANLRWQLGSAIGFYLGGSAELFPWAKTLRLYEAAGHDKLVSPLEHLHLLLSLAFVDCFAGQYDASRAYVRQGLALGQETGVHVYDLFLLAVGAYNGLMQARLAEADRHLEEMRLILASQPPNFHTVHYRLLLNWRALVAGQFADAVDHGRAALALALENGAVYPLARCRHGLALALIAHDQPQEALALLDQARIRWGAAYLQQMEHDCGLSEAWLRLRMGEEATAARLLAAALQQGREQGWGLPLWSFPDWIEPLLRFALEWGIETARVQELIRQAGLLPHEANGGIPANWPLPVRVKALGTFVVEVGGKLLTLETPSQNRPLELLKALIALGGRDVADERLMDILWPDAGGDAAARSLHTTLHRLRKLLGTEQAITLKDRVVSLDPRQVWLDVWAFERTLEQFRQQLDSPHPHSETVRRLWQTLSTLYAGSFLGKGAQKSWALDMAERLRSRMLRFTLAVGEYWEKASGWEQAIQVYRKGLEIDPLVESFYQGLMRCYESLGRPSEALAAYGRCRKVLGEGLNVMPGAETVKLYKDIRTRAETTP
ncbi:ATP-, maltotriose-and DNA-dependent transcriptional regulator MalT [Thiothrix caldifontis]|uniref:ATP-, maltotriose-and DNA-dependent transcriptional regulator MalT n=1 Tax=Thiothrix caldifontis TaxID=525918 RepID=A0A1H3ZMU9_9GAMM|nr:BTAD domain-containing putative transcriptional regulator [Thiothrix caldifontis]SEA24975.1 ATP-, maltotriose-and DNA-dependent transcriptional regulator MalT [Thiothrix caldifontis]